MPDHVVFALGGTSLPTHQCAFSATVLALQECHSMNARPERRGAFLPFLSTQNSAFIIAARIQISASRRIAAFVMSPVASAPGKRPFLTS
jgi:hypothetical protein